MLYRLRLNNQRWRQYAPMLISENIWRAQRYGVEGSLMDYGKGVLVPFSDLVEEMIEMFDPTPRSSAVCRIGAVGIRAIVAGGTSADRQIATYRPGACGGASNEEALKTVVDQLIADTAAAPPVRPQASSRAPSAQERFSSGSWRRCCSTQPIAGARSDQRNQSKHGQRLGHRFRGGGPLVAGERGEGVPGLKAAAGATPSPTFGSARRSRPKPSVPLLPRSGTGASRRLAPLGL